MNKWLEAYNKASKILSDNRSEFQTKEEQDIYEWLQQMIEDHVDNVLDEDSLVAITHE